MDCKLQTENARKLDKILANHTIPTITVRLDTNLMIQARLENSILFTTIKICNGFFDYLEITRPACFETTKVKFYEHGMEFLKIRLEKYQLIYEWKFENYIRKKIVRISHGEFNDISFEATKIFTFECDLIYEILKNLWCNEIKVEFNKNLIVFRDVKNDKNLISLENFTRVYDFTFIVLRKNLKIPFLGDFEVAEFLVDVEDRKINVCLEEENLAVSHLICVFIEEK